MYRRLRDLREDNDFTQNTLPKNFRLLTLLMQKIERGERILSADVIIKTFKSI